LAALSARRSQFYEVVMIPDLLIIWVAPIAGGSSSHSSSAAIGPIAPA
jgi:hypothetical protein